MPFLFSIPSVFVFISTVHGSLDIGINSAVACWHHWILLLKTTSSGGLYIFLAFGTLQISVVFYKQSHVNFIGHTPHVFV